MCILFATTSEISIRAIFPQKKFLLCDTFSLFVIYSQSHIFQRETLQLFREKNTVGRRNAAAARQSQIWLRASGAIKAPLAVRYFIYKLKCIIERRVRICSYIYIFFVVSIRCVFRGHARASKSTTRIKRAVDIFLFVFYYFPNGS